MAAGLLAAAPLLAADWTVRPAGAPPGGLSEAVKAALPAEGLAVEAGGKVAAEFWIRREIDKRDGGATKLGVEFASIPEGSLLGAVRFPEGFNDYKGDALPAGVYTLRYAVQPADGNHMGVSLHRDFVLLVPAADDPGAKPLAVADLHAASRKATGTKHPAVLAVFPVAADAKPASVVLNELDQPLLVVQAGDARLGLVLKGRGE